MVVSTQKEAFLPVDLRTIQLNELNLVGTKVYNFRDYWKTIDFLASGGIDPDLFISKVLPLSSFEKGLDLMKKGTDSLKILLYPE